MFRMKNVEAWSMVLGSEPLKIYNIMINCYLQLQPLKNLILFIMDDFGKKKILEPQQYCF